MTTSTDRALERVQNLYLMQFELLDLLEQDLRDPEVRKTVRGRMKEFGTLLSKADWRYMGGIDVWETLQQLPLEMSRKLRESSGSVAARRRVKKKVVRAVRVKAWAVKKVKGRKSRK